LIVYLRFLEHKSLILLADKLKAYFKQQLDLVGLLATAYKTRLYVCCSLFMNLSASAPWTGLDESPVVYKYFLYF